MAFGSIRAGQCGDLGALSAVDDNRAAGARRIIQAGEARGAILVAQSGEGDGGQGEGSGNIGEGLATVEFEQGGGAFEGLGRQRAFGEQRLELVTIRGGEGKMLFLHQRSLPEGRRKRKKTSLTD